MEENNKNKDISNEPLISGYGHSVNKLENNRDSHDVTHNISDANNTLHSHNTTDSNNTHNSHNTVTNTSNTSNNVGSIGVINNYSGRAADEKLLSEKKNDYLEFCRKVINNGLISQPVRNQLENKRLELGLSIDDTAELERLAKSNNRSRNFNERDKKLLEDAKKAILNNENELSSELLSLKSITERVYDDEVHFYYYLLLLIAKPQDLINCYNNRTYDDYWMTYWVYIAYMRNKLTDKAVEVISVLSNFQDYPSENIDLLTITQLLYDHCLEENNNSNRLNKALSKLNNCQSHSEILYPFVQALEFKANYPTNISNDNQCNFYLRIFSIKSKKSKPQPIKPQPTKQQPLSYGTYSQNNSSNNGVSQGAINAIGQNGNTNNNTTTRPKDKSGNIGVSDAAINIIGNNSEKGQKGHNTTTPTPNPNNVLQGSNNGDKIKELLRKAAKRGIIAIVVIACIFIGVKLLTPSSQVSTSTTPETVAPTEPVDTKSQSNTSESAKTKTSTKKSQPKQTTTTTSQKTSGGTSASAPKTTSATTTQNVSTANNNQAAQATPTPVAEPTANELLQEGIKLQQTFKHERALAKFKQAAAKGSSMAYLYIGDLYYNGGNIDKNYNAAFNAYKTAAEADITDAQYMLGVMYRNGHGCAKDKSSASYWWSLAAQKGHAKAAKALNDL